MSLPDVVSREDWRAARIALLEQEKALTKARDALNVKRRELPMVEIDKDYVFEGPDGPASLLDLFEGRLQLILGHFMFDPSWDDGCPSCSAGCDEVSDGLLAHLHARDTTLAYVARAPLEKIEDYKSRKGWTFPFYSSHGSDFNYDFHVTLDAAVAPVEYNFRSAEEHAANGFEFFTDPDAAPDRDARRELLPARRRAGLPHELDVRPRRRDDRRLVLLPRPDGARAPGGLGAAAGPRRLRPRRAAGLRRLRGGRPA